MSSRALLLLLAIVTLSTRAHGTATALPGAQVTILTKVIPGASFDVQIAFTLNGIAAGAQLEAVFTGLSLGWSSVQTQFLTQRSRSGNSFILGASLRAPFLEGRFENLEWTVRTVGSSFASGVHGFVSAPTPLEVTCSDGIYCNGIERLVRQTCESATALPCVSPSGDPCSSYECLESKSSCARTPLGGASCSACLATACRASCRNKLCGDDGCGGSCGSCVDGQSCIAGTCELVGNLSGSCNNPEPLPGVLAGGLVPDEGIQYDLLGDNRNTVDLIQPLCNLPGMGEYVYKFRVAVPMGFEIRMTPAPGVNPELDTVLAVHDANCQPILLSAVDLLCSDDQTPPGIYGSRVNGLLPVGTYTLIATGWSAAELNAYKLAFKFTPGCMPKCESKFCGDDGCGRSCGNCSTGTACFSGRCQAIPCTPNCQARKCGADGCGGTCGNCKNKQVCDELEGVCVPVKSCNNMAPVCQGTGSQQQFCGSDCEWHKINEPMPDLVANSEEEVIPTAYFQWDEFPETSCSILEGCIKAPGRRLLLRFDTRVHNVGTATFFGPSISKNPHLFVWGSCHQHYHFQKFANFNLYNATSGALALPGGKLSYCMEDGYQYLSGPDIPCEQQFTCSEQGIPRGRSDLYQGLLDCQWLDITDLQPKNVFYEYEVCTNIGRTIFEMTYENNCQRFPIFVADLPDGSPTISYADALAQHYSRR